MWNFLDGLKAASSARTAIAGDGSGNLDVPSRPNYIYARTLEDDATEIVEVRITTIRPNYGDSILIGLIHPQTQIGGWRMLFWLRDINDVTAPPPIVGDTNNR